MIQVIHSKTYRARKRYRCNAYWEVMEGGEGWLSDEEQCQVDMMRLKKGYIEVGDLYVRQFNTDGGDTWTYRASVDMHNICIKHDLFDN